MEAWSDHSTPPGTRRMRLACLAYPSSGRAAARRQDASLVGGLVHANCSLVLVEAPVLWEGTHAAAPPRRGELGAREHRCMVRRAAHLLWKAEGRARALPRGGRRGRGRHLGARWRERRGWRVPPEREAGAAHCKASVLRLVASDGAPAERMLRVTHRRLTHHTRLRGMRKLWGCESIRSL